MHSVHWAVEWKYVRRTLVSNRGFLGAGRPGRSFREVFDRMEFFYGPQRIHVRNGMKAPITFETQQKLKAF